LRAKSNCRLYHPQGKQWYVSFKEYKGFAKVYAKKQKYLTDAVRNLPTSQRQFFSLLAPAAPPPPLPLVSQVQEQQTALAPSAEKARKCEEEEIVTGLYVTSL